MPSLAEIHTKKGLPFDELYQQVTKNILAYKQKGSGVPVYQQYPVVDFWVDSFSRRYNKWVTNETVYLDWLYVQQLPWYRKYRNMEPVFILCGLAFLHIAWDLPVSIADSLQEPAYNHYTDDVCKLNELKILFNELEKPITDATSSQWKKPLLVKLMLFPPLELQAIFTLWIINLRTKAWDNAMYLFCNPGTGPTDPKFLLQKAVLQAMQAARTRSRIFFYKRIVALTIPATGGLGLTALGFYNSGLLAAVAIAVAFGFFLLYLNQYLLKGFYSSVLQDFTVLPDNDTETRNETTGAFA